MATLAAVAQAPATPVLHQSGEALLAPVALAVPEPEQLMPFKMVARPMLQD
jgi:hypothetical protein